MTTTTVSPTSQAVGIVNFASGSITGDGNDTRVLTGFQPRYVRLFNESDTVLWEKFEGQADANTLKADLTATTAAPGSLDTSSSIVLDSRGFTILAAALGSTKVGRWVAFG